ncbi:hypothetical protein V757_01920 [Pelistega indica]|uniref:Terminase n=1 Tax=Pelistega indica TaxID=1414851 RepID=V8G8S0_9BURK|nr:hypothetical protein [Pelistega indica]ETD72820.1 hypothetical protein V757_01920 [Pelistega indica]
MREINYHPAPTVLDFHNSTKPYKALAGPPGAGKTVGALWEWIFRAMRQTPDRNNKRRYRVVTIRASYPNLETTTIKTVKDWMDPTWGHIVMSKPPTGLWSWNMPDGTKVELEMIFMAVEDGEVAEKMKSLEPSGIWLTEATEVTRDVFEMSVQRIGRFPSAKDGVLCDEPGIVFDFNLPGTDHWLYDLCVRNKSDELDFFMQPPAVFCTNFEKADAGEEPPQYVMNPDAENLANLPSGYYEKQLAAYKHWGKVKSFLLMKWATFNTDKRVFPEFARSAHVASVATEPIRGLPVYVGIDTSGLNPGAVFGQLQAGTLVILDEVYGSDMPFIEFIERGLQPLIAERYAGAKLLAICDPSNPRDAMTGQTAIQKLQQYGIRAEPARSNKFKLRREAVADFLVRRSGIVIDPSCQMTIMAMEEKYVYRRLRINSTMGVQYATEPDKNGYSHVMDALQYLCLFLTMPNNTIDNDGMVQEYKGKIRPRALLR